MPQAADHVSTMYITINRERIPVPESVIKAIRKENNHVRYLARREHRCAQPNYSLCRGDCQLCRWKCIGIIENFEEAEARYNLVDDTDIEADFLLKDTINEIMHLLSRFCFWTGCVFYHEVFLSSHDVRFMVTACNGGIHSKHARIT